MLFRLFRIVQIAPATDDYAGMVSYREVLDRELSLGELLNAIDLVDDERKNLF